MKLFTTALCIAASLATATAAKAQTIYLSFSGGGGTPIVITLASPVTYTITGLPNPGTVDPYFVFNEVGNVFGVDAPLTGGGAPTYTGVGIPDPTLTINSISSGESSHGAIDSLNDIKFRHTPSGGTTFLFTGEVFNLTAGTFMTANNFFGALPANGFYETFIMDASYTYLGAGSTSAIPEPSTYAALAGVAALALAGWRRSRRVREFFLGSCASFAAMGKPALLLAALFASISAGRLNAQSYLLTSPGAGSVYSNSTVETVYPIGHYNLGYEFTVGASALSVSALGFYDSGANGLNYAHSVGLWNTSGALLASVSLTAGVHPLTNGFIFQSLSSPVVLSANTNYVLGAAWNALGMTPQDALHFNPNGSAPTFFDATLVGDRYGTFGNAPSVLSFPGGTDWSSANTGAVSGFTVPPLAGGAGASFIGANMAYSAIPEPSTYAALAGAVALGLAIWRRRSRVCSTTRFVTDESTHA